MEQTNNNQINDQETESEVNNEIVAGLEKMIESLESERDGLKDELKKSKIKHLADLQDAVRGADKMSKAAMNAKVIEISKDIIADLDLLYMALYSAKSSSDPATKNILAGLEMVIGSIENNLGKRGVFKVPAAVGDQYDSNNHKAVEITHEGADSDDTITKVFKDGWKINADNESILIRPAHVQIYKKKEE